MESAITSRLTSDARIPDVPIVIPSDTAIVLNSTGAPPASRTPSRTYFAKSPRWTLHGIVSVHVLAMPMSGLSKSSSVNPTARRYERAGARSGPSTSWRLPSFGRRPPPFDFEDVGDFEDNSARVVHAGTAAPGARVSGRPARAARWESAAAPAPLRRSRGR